MNPLAPPPDLRAHPGGGVLAARDDEAGQMRAHRGDRGDRREAVAIGQLEVDEDEVEIGIDDEACDALDRAVREGEMPVGTSLRDHRGKAVDEQRVVADQQ